MYTIAVIGGGAAGFFGAIAFAKNNPDAEVILIEKSAVVLSKVRISGGGRCNVTHSCFDPIKLSKHYPRGEKALIGPFHRFQPRDTINWFESNGVTLKTEEDGRMFPVTNDSQTIIDCLMREANKSGVKIKLRHKVASVKKENERFHIIFADHSEMICDKLLLASGSSQDGFDIATHFGHQIIPPVPSLFTFNVPNFSLVDLAGISVNQAEVKLKNTTHAQQGPLLITHWGFSGPAALKLSTWAARHLHEMNYETTLIVNWLPELNQKQVFEQLMQMKVEFPAQYISKNNPFGFAKQLWKRLIELASLDSETCWNAILKSQLQHFVEQLQAHAFDVKGKTTYKQEFVTCGGVSLDEVSFKTMESRLCTGLYFAGEILDIDGITGGFNFQNAWTTAWIAGHS